MKWILLFTVTSLFASIGSAAAQTNAPSPFEVGTQLNGLWASNQFAQIDVYVAGLVTNFPNYVPALLASACYEGVFRSNISNLLTRIDRVQQADVGSDYFKVLLSAERGQMQAILHSYYSAGTSHADLTNAANAQTVRSRVPEWPYLELITNAPSINVQPP